MTRSRLGQDDAAITEATITFHVSTISEIPQSELPDPAARAALIELAESGVEVYAYTPACSEQHTIWLRPFTAEVDGRMTCADWQRIYQQEASEEALANLIPRLRDAQQTYIRLASAFLDHQEPAPSRDEITRADTQVRELEQVVRLTRWRLANKRPAA